MSFSDFQKAFKRIKDGYGGILDIGFLSGYVTKLIAVKYDEDGKFDRMVVKPTFDAESFKLNDACLAGPRNKGLTFKVKKTCKIILQVLQNHKVARKMNESRTETPIMLLKKNISRSMADPFTISLCPNRYGWDNRMPGGRMIELDVEDAVEYILEPANPFNYSAK